MDWIQKQTQLLKIAEADEIYCIWRRDFLDAQKLFQEYTDNQPEEVRNFLQQYADCGRMMNQRLVNLACMHMHFTRRK